MLASGADLGQRDGDGLTPLMLAVKAAPSDIVELLLRRDPQADAALGGPPLVWAAAHQRPRLVEALLDGGADVNVRDAQGRTALMVAAWGGAADVVAILLQHHADLDARDAHGATALGMARRARQREVARLLEQSRRDRRTQG